MLGRERHERANGRDQRRFGAAAHQQTDERLDAAKFRHGGLIGRMVITHRPERAGAHLLDERRALTHEGRERRDGTRPRNCRLVVRVRLGQGAERARRVGLHVRIRRAEHRDERLDGARVGERSLVEPVALGELRRGKGGECVELRCDPNVGSLLLLAIRLGRNDHARQQRDAARLGDLLLDRAARGELRDGPDCPLFGLRRRRGLEERQQGCDAARLDDRIAVSVRIGREVGEGGSRLLLSTRLAALVIQHAHELVNDQLSVAILNREADERALGELARNWVGGAEQEHEVTDRTRLGDGDPVVRVVRERMQSPRRGLLRRRAVLAREQRNEGRDGPRLRDGTRGARVGHSEVCEGRGRASLGSVLTIVEQRDERRDASRLDDGVTVGCEASE